MWSCGSKWEPVASESVHAAVLMISEFGVDPVWVVGQPLKALCGGQDEYSRVEVIKAHCNWVFGHQHGGGGLKGRGDSCLDQQQVGDVGQDLSQLSSTDS